MVPKEKSESLIGLVIAVSLLIHINATIRNVPVFNMRNINAVFPPVNWGVVFIMSGVLLSFGSDSDYPALIRRSTFLKTELRLLLLWQIFIGFVLLSPQGFGYIFPKVMVIGVAAIFGLLSISLVGRQYFKA